MLRSMNTSRMILVLSACFALQACGGGDEEQESTTTSTMPCKYRPDCTAGPPLGSQPEPPLPPASAASGV